MLVWTENMTCDELVGVAGCLSRGCVKRCTMFVLVLGPQMIIGVLLV